MSIYHNGETVLWRDGDNGWQRGWYYARTSTQVLVLASLQDIRYLDPQDVHKLEDTERDESIQELIDRMRRYLNNRTPEAIEKERVTNAVIEALAELTDRVDVNNIEIREAIDGLTEQVNTLLAQV